MKNHLTILLVIAIAFLTPTCKSGLVTMTNGCYNLITTGQTQNQAGNYSGALDSYNTVLKKCDAYDAKEKAYAGKAKAHNGLRQYDEALNAANAGLKINGSSIDNLFEKASAELGLGMTDNARADLNTIVSQTEKNRNIPQRATIIAKIAETEMKQQQYNEALQHIGQAIKMDPANLSFYMQRGDINVAAGNLSAAISNYDEAIGQGKNDAEAWKARTTTLVKQLQKKYDTDNADELKRKISAADRQALCTSIRSSQDKGMHDVNIDLLQVTICK